MKVYIYMVFIIFNISTLKAQFVHIHMNNKDKETRKKMGTHLTMLAIQTGALYYQNRDIDDMIKNYRELLKRNYDKSKFDKKIGYSRISKQTLGLVAGLLGQYGNKAYITKNKKEHMKQINHLRSLLLNLVLIKYDKIRLSKRQEIEELNKDLLNQFAKNDNTIYNYLMLPGIIEVLDNKDGIISTLNQLDNFF